MPVEPGQSLLHYRIAEKLGAGGMGEVWKAVDTTLDREVALKVLPETFAADPQRLARFEREARLLASLNHANIATIHGLHSTPEGLTFLAMEIVPGEDLARRIARGPVPVDTALGLARQIANGLAMAHASGVIHRDLKPANIRITPRGDVKVLDFGLAKALAPPSAASGSDPSASPTLTSAGSTAGMILGTAAYMSPEQACGLAADRRADVWAFGCVLYEMLTGRQVFRGGTVSDVLAAVLRADPDWSALPAETPSSVRRLLRRCLERDPERRLHDIADARIEIDDAGAEPVAPAAPAPAARRPSRLPWMLLAAVGLIAVAAVVQVWTRGSGAAPLFRYEQKTFDREVIYTARFMPDGQTLVYSSARIGNRPEIFLLQAGSLAPRSIAPLGTHLLSVSPEGELAVLTDTTYLGVHRLLKGTLARMTIDGAPRALVEDVRDADWGPDGELAVVHRVSGMDRLEYPLGRVLYETTGYVSEPRVAADGSRVAFLDHPPADMGAGFDDRGRVKLVDLQGAVETSTGEFKAVEGLAWSRGDGRLLFSGSGGSGAAAALLQPMSVAPGGHDTRTEAGVPGSLVVVDAAPGGRWLVLGFDLRSGVAVRPPGGGTDIDLTWLDHSWGGTLSPDGETLAFTNGHGGDDYSVVMRRVDGSPVTTLGPGDSIDFSPDGRWVAALLSSRQEIVLYPVGAGETRRIERGPIESYAMVEWFPDSRSLMVVGNEPSAAVRSYRQSIDGGPPRPVTPGGVFGTLSPRGDRILGLESGMTWKLFPIDGGPPIAAPGLGPSDELAGWSVDGNAVYTCHVGDVPLRLDRVDLTTGARTPSLEIGPHGVHGLVGIELASHVLDPDRSIPYMTMWQTSTLYVVEQVSR